MLIILNFNQFLPNRVMIRTVEKCFSIRLILRHWKRPNLEKTNDRACRDGCSLGMCIRVRRASVVATRTSYNLQSPSGTTSL